MRIAAVGALASLIASSVATAQNCPEPLASARKLVLVISENMASKTATMQRFERADVAEPWRPIGVATPALIGHNGMGWAQAFRALARAKEPMKVEGDKRAPAGFYKVGASFGFAPSPRLNYLQISEGTVCVDDLASPHYDSVTTRAKVGWTVHGENMWRVPAYRHGLLVEYPSNAKTRTGSCIFVHLRLPDAKGTSGCVALPEADLISLQDFAEGGAVLAVVPKGARQRLPGCLP